MISEREREKFILHLQLKEKNLREIKKRAHVIESRRGTDADKTKPMHRATLYRHVLIYSLP